MLELGLEREYRASCSAGSVDLPYFHRDIVTKLPAGAQNLGSNACTNIQAYYIPGVALCVQGHPEFSADSAFYTALWHFTWRRTTPDEPIVSYAQDERAHHDFIALLMYRFIEIQARKKQNL